MADADGARQRLAGEQRIGQQRLPPQGGQSRAVVGRQGFQALEPLRPAWVGLAEGGRQIRDCRPQGRSLGLQASAANGQQQRPQHGRCPRRRPPTTAFLKLGNHPHQ